MADYNVSGADINLLKDTVNNYYKIINTTREARKLSKNSREEMLVFIAECDRILEEIIDKLMFTYKLSHPDFYLEYYNARRIGGWKKKKEEVNNPAA